MAGIRQVLNLAAGSHVVSRRDTTARGDDGMPRPGDWDAIGLPADPTPGDPETITQLADIFQHLGSKAREIYNAIETVMNTTDDSVFAGATADALRAKVDNRLRGHVEDVAWAFETSAQALRDWHSVVVEQQSKADAALNVGRGLAEDDPERQRQADLAKQAGEYQAEQGQSVAGRIRTVSHISLPISGCQVFWEAFQWLAIILIIPALVLGGPIALLALGVNLALFLKTAVDFANGDAGFLDLFLAGLGLIAPTTKALPIFSILKGIGKAVLTGAKGLLQGIKQVFTRDFLFTRLLPGLSHLPIVASVAIRDTGLFVVSGLRHVVGFAGGLLRSPVRFTLGVLRGAYNANVGMVRAISNGFAFAGSKTWAGIQTGWAFARQELGGTRFLRLILPVDAGEIRAFGFWGALKIGVVNRGLFGQHVFGAPLAGAVGRGISAAPVTPPALHTGLDGIGSLSQVVSNPPAMDLGAIRIGTDLTSLPGHGFHAAKAVDGLDGIRLGDVVNVRSGDLGMSVAGTTSVTASGLHLPATAGTAAPVTHGAAVTSGLAAVPNPGVHGTATSIGDLLAPAVRGNNPALGLPPSIGSRIGEGTTNALVANQLRLNLDDLVTIPPAQHLSVGQGIQPPSVDRVSAALQLVDNTKPAGRVGSADGIPPSASYGEKVAVRPIAVDGPGTAGKNLPAPVRSEVPLSGIPDRPDVYVRIEKQGSLVSHQLFNGGPHGRIEPLPGGQLRFTDTASGQTFRFDANGNLVDQGTRFMKPEGAKAGQWDADLAARAGVFRRPGDSDLAVQARMADWERIQRAQQHVDATRLRLDSLAGRPDSSSAGHPLDQVRLELGAAERTLRDLKGTFGATHGLDPDGIGRSLDELVVASINERPRAVGGVKAAAAGPEIRVLPLSGIPDHPGIRVRIEGTGGNVTHHLVGGGAQSRLEVLAGGNLRITDVTSGRTFHFNPNGAPLSQGTRLGGAPGQVDRVVVHQPGGAFVLTDLAGQSVPGVTVRRTGPGGFRIIQEDGVSRQFGPAGSFQVESLSLADGNQIRGQWFVEDGPAGQRIVDNDGVPRPGVTARRLGDGRVLVVDATGGAWYLRDGMQDVTAARAGVSLRLTEPGGNVRTFDLDGNPTVGIRSQTVASFDGYVAQLDNGGLRWSSDTGQLAVHHRITPTNTGGVRIEVDLPGAARHGEFHELDATGKLARQGFPVVGNGRATTYDYVVDHLSGTWSRVNRVDNSIGDGAFHHGKVDLAGIENGRIRLLSSTGKPVEVFERRWLPDGLVLDSFRTTDTLGFGKVNRSTTWASYDQNSNLTGWGTRHFDTTGSGWRDVDQSWRTIREYRGGLQKYHSSTGHVLAIKQDDGWKWFRYDDHAALVAQGDRTLERIGDGWTDTITRRINGQDVTDVAQQKWGAWHLPENAGQYQEFTLTRAADGSVDRPGTWTQHARQGKESGSGTKVGTELLTVTRQGEQRPPVWVRESPLLDNPRPTGIAAHLADDNRFQIFHWEHGRQQNGIRYTAMDGGFVDVNRHGDFVRSSSTLSDGTKLKVGGDTRVPQATHPNGGIPWEAGGDSGWRLVTGETWRDVKQVNGTWEVIRESRPGGVVREYHDVAIRTLWTERDAHGNLTGLSTRQLERPGAFFVQAMGSADSARWTWRLVDKDGIPVAGRGGQRQFFRGSTDDALSWDDSFCDFDAGGNLVRDRRMLDGGRYVESWQTPVGWKSGEFDKLGQRVAGSVDLDRLWSTGDGVWHRDWESGAVYSRDQLPPTGALGAQVVRETPTHLDGGPLRIREYHLDNGVTQYGRWKEFDHGTVVRQRQPSGPNYLETDAWRGQWKLYDQHGNLLGERADNGLVFEMRNGKLHLTGNEYDFRGPLTELRGWGRRVREAQRMPWLTGSDWTMRGSTLTPYGNAVREARYAPAWKVIGQKAMLEFAQEFVLEFTANLIVNAIVAAAQNKPFSGNDALKALMNAGVTSTIKTGVGSVLGDTKLGGELRNLKLGMANLDTGKHWNRRPMNHDKFWGNEWGGNESATRWRGGVYDFGFNLGPSVLSGFVNGTMNAAIFGVSNADGTTVKLSGGAAAGDGGINALASLTTGVSTALVKNVALGFGGSRFFHRQGFGDFWLQLPFRVFEKSIQSVFLTSAYRASINPPWFQVPPGFVPHESGLVVPAGSEGTL